MINSRAGQDGCLDSRATNTDAGIDDLADWIDGTTSGFIDLIAADLISDGNADIMSVYNTTGYLTRWYGDGNGRDARRRTAIGPGWGPFATS